MLSIRTSAGTRIERGLHEHYRDVLFDELRPKALIFINEISRAAVDKFFLKKLRFLSTEFFILLGPPPT